MEHPNIWFRFESREDYEGGVELYLLRFRVLKYTQKTVLLRTTKPFTRRVPLEARKRWACPTVEEALESFIRRKECQLEHLLRQQKYTLDALNAARYPCDYELKEWGLNPERRER